MDSLQATAFVLQGLEAVEIDYIVVGAFSSNIWGIARSTKDADIVLKLEAGGLAQLMQQLTDDFQLDRQMQLETLTGSVRNVITFLPTDYKVELFRLGKDEHHQERFRRRVRAQIPELNREAWVPTAEDVVIQKLRWARRKDLDDVESVLGVQSGKLDNAYLDFWTRKHGTRDLLDELIDGIGEEPPQDKNETT